MFIQNSKNLIKKRKQKMAKDSILKRRMAEAGLSQREVARTLNRHFQHINYVVNGIRKSQRLSARILALCNNRIPSLQTAKPTRRYRRVK